MNHIWEFLDRCCGIRDPLWGSLGWLAVIIGLGVPFYLFYLMFYVNLPGWKDKRGRPDRWRWWRD